MKKFKIPFFIFSVFLFSCAKDNISSSVFESKESLSTISNISTENNTSQNNTSSFNSILTENNVTSSSENISSTINSSSENVASSNSSYIADKELNYQEKIDAYLDGATIADKKFIEKIKNIGEYQENESPSSNAIYASSTASSSGDGSIENPYPLQDAIDSVEAGQTLYLRGGTYDSKSLDGYFLTARGNENAYITIRPYRDEKVVITNSYRGKEVYGFQVDAGACYFILEGLEIKDIKSSCGYGIAFWGDNQNHIIIRNNNIHNIETTSSNPENDSDAGANAILLNGEKSNPISNIALMNNYCHDNITGWSETLSVTANCEYVYVFENKVSNNTNIGIDFYGNAGYCKTASLDQPRYCVAANNLVENSFCSYAECAGLYVDGARDIILQYNTVKNCQFGIEIGSEEGHKQPNYPVKNIVVRSNVCAENKVTGLRIGGYDKKKTGYVQDTTIINNTFINNTKVEGEQSAEIILAKVDNIVFKNNLILKDNEGAIIKTDFDDNYAKNLHFVNNLIYQNKKTKDTILFEMFLNSQEGLDNFNSLISGTMLFNEVYLQSDYKLSANSYAIDRGQSDSLLGNYDYNLNSRVKNVVDIGACEA